MHRSQDMHFEESADEEAEELLFKLWAISKKSAYQFIQKNRQRIYASIAIKKMPYPPKGSEVFISNLPKNMYEDELVPLFEGVGPLYKFRLMLDFHYDNRGFAFATYFNKQDADSAVKMLQGRQVRSGHYITVLKSVDNRCLFIGNLPLYVTKSNLLQLLDDHFEGVVTVTMQSNYIHPHLNRGYAFAEFLEHQLAVKAWKMFTPGRNNLMAWGQAVYIDWADPVPEVDPQVMAKVCNLYLKNLPMEYTSDELRTKLGTVVGDQVLRKVHKIRNYAFVHFISRQSAEVALIKLSGLVLTNSQGFKHAVQVEWAKPKRFSKKLRPASDQNSYSCKSVPSKKRRKIFEYTTNTRAPVYCITDSGHSTCASQLPGSSSSGIN